MMVLTTFHQQMLIDVQSRWSHLFNTFVFVTGRRSGKGLMGIEMIVDEIRHLRGGTVPPRDGHVLYVVHLSISDQMAGFIEDSLKSAITSHFPVRVGTNIELDGVDVSGKMFPIILSVGTTKNDRSVGFDVSLRVVDEMVGPLDGLAHICGRTVMFRSEHDPEDGRPGVAVIEIDRNDLLPPTAR